MPASKAPALVSSPSDFVQYRISDADPVDPAAKEGYQERFIHSEIYKTFPYINSVVHSHSEAVLPYTMNGVPMQPAFHITGFLGMS
jgi:ribulose-5-phosphate 4-epimerase/fuculose-1-phosphate aldolase